MSAERPRGRRGSARAATLAVLAAPLLSGCVAAAIPVLAAGGLATTRTGDHPAKNRPEVALPADRLATGAVAAAPASSSAIPQTPARRSEATVREVAYADGSTVTITNALPARRDFAQPSSLDFSGARPTGLSDIPPPSNAAGPGTRDDAAAFAAFAARQAAIPVVGGERRSALLVDSASMKSETRGCSIHPAAVLIDLDPAGGTIDLSRPLAADPAFASRLAGLRTEGVTIGWTTSRTADQAGAIRKALVTSGLDPAGRDELVLLRFPEERKHTRRDEFAKSHCVVAIAGDERADFDELFAYLRDPSIAHPLEKLIGAGWFIVPPPLAANQGPTD